MFIDDKMILALTQLGLTVLESKVYIVLCKHGKLSTKEISKLTETAQSDVYRVVYSLQQKGLVEKQIENPVSFKSVPFETGSAFLLERKKSEYTDLQQQIELIGRQFKAKSIDKPTISADSHFLMIPKRENVVKRIGEAIDRSKRRVDLFLSWKRFYNGMTRVFAESSERAWGRGVQFRIIVEMPQEDSAQKKALEFCTKSPMCAIRFLQSHPKTVMGIYDSKEVFIVVNPREGLFDSPALWSNNQSLIMAIQEYYNLLWPISMEKPSQDLTQF